MIDNSIGTQPITKFGRKISSVSLYQELREAQKFLGRDTNGNAWINLNN